MNNHILIDYGTAAAYFAFNADLIFQILRVNRRQSSSDISLLGILIRLIGGLLIMVKFVALGDPYLILGQAVTLSLVTIYLWLVIKHRPKKKKKR